VGFGQGCSENLEGDMAAHKKFVLIGHPVAHSVSPAIHQAAYLALGVGHEYEAIDCPTESAVKVQVDRVRSGAIAGANVTVPHKRLALALADHAHPSASRVGAANVLLKDAQGAIVAHNTDALALADELGTTTPDKAAVVIGNGGAALAAVVACQATGAGEVFVSARKFVSNARENWPMAQQLQDLGAKLLPWGTAELDAAFERAAYVVQATSAGMKGADAGTEVARIIPWSKLSKTVLMMDLVYNPAITPFLAQAIDHGLSAKNGLGMLVGQAARAFSLWLDVPAPISAMRSAAALALHGGLAS